MSVASRVEPGTRHPVTHGRVVMAKVLAGICIVAFFIAIPALVAAVSRGEDSRLVGVIERSSSHTPQDLLLALGCFAIGLAAMSSAIRIRHGMGRPVFEPLHGW
jgi:hypothetical protein